MTQIVINHNGSIPNVDAMEACIAFAFENYCTREYKDSRDIRTKRGFNLRVTERPDKTSSPHSCSTVLKLSPYQIPEDK